MEKLIASWSLGVLEVPSSILMSWGLQVRGCGFQSPEWLPVGPETRGYLPLGMCSQPGVALPSLPCAAYAAYTPCAAPVQHNAAAPVQQNATPVQHNAAPTQHNAASVQHNAAPMQHNAAPVQA